MIVSTQRLIHRSGQRIYILPTVAGLLFFVVLLLIFVIATAYRNNLAYLMTFMLASMSLMAMVHTHYNLFGMCVSDVRVRSDFVGLKAVVHLTLGNTSRRPGQHIRVAVRGVRGAEAVAIQVAPVLRERIVLTLPLSRRGRFELPRLIVSTAHPTGLFRSWMRLMPACVYHAYPRPEGRHALPARAEQGPAGKRFATPAPEDFQGQRAYQPGDSLRQVDWKAHAKGYPLLTKVFKGEGGGLVRLRWADASGLTTEARLSQLARWVKVASEGRFRFALEIPGRALPFGSGKRHYGECLEALAEFPGPDASGAVDVADPVAPTIVSAAAATAPEIDPRSREVPP